MYRVIDDDYKLMDLISYLKKEKISKLYIDIEAENNFHAYGISLSLLQISDGRSIWVIDCMKISEPSLLIRILEGEDFIKIMFDSSGDQIVFDTSLGIKAKPIIDLKLGFDILGVRESLSKLIKKYDDTPIKSCQKSNWSRRPLSDKQIKYAAFDVKYLKDLANDMYRKLYEAGKIEEFIHRNHVITNKIRKVNPYLGYKKLLQSNRVSRKKECFLRSIWIAREKLAKETNIVPNNILSKYQIEYITRNYIDLDLETIDMLFKKWKKKYDSKRFLLIYEAIKDLDWEAENIF